MFPTTCLPTVAISPHRVTGAATTPRSGTRNALEEDAPSPPVVACSIHTSPLSFSLDEKSDRNSVHRTLREDQGQRTGAFASLSRD
jgi:hypothetical protein